MQKSNRRSEEVLEILSDVPGWITRWGITGIFLILTLAFLASWFIKYPNTVVGEVVVTTEVPPAYLVARAPGKLKIFVKENQKVAKSDPLCLIENAAHMEDVFYLMDVFDKIRSGIYREDFRALDHIRENLQVGEIQESYLYFLRSIKDYQREVKFDLQQNQIISLSKELEIARALYTQYQRELQLMSEELEFGKNIFHRDSLLWKQGVLADLSYESSQSAYVRLKRLYESMRSNNLNNAIQIARLTSQINVLKIEQQENGDKLKNEIIAAYKQCNSDIQLWEEKYLLTAPVEGEVSFFNTYWANNQNVNAGDEVVAVIPDSRNIIGKVRTPIAGSGNIEVGQRVNIRFYNYPANEYGKVNSQVQAISRLPKDSFYEITVIFPEGLTSSYKRELQFKQHMEGEAKIVTNDLRLIERIFNKLRQIFERANNT